MNLIFWLDVWLLSTILGAVLFRIWHQYDADNDCFAQVLLTGLAAAVCAVSLVIARANARGVLFGYLGTSVGGILGYAWVWFLGQKELKAKAQALVDAHIKRAADKLDAELDAQARKMRGR